MVDARALSEAIFRLLNRLYPDEMDQVNRVAAIAIVYEVNNFNSIAMLTEALNEEGNK